MNVAAEDLEARLHGEWEADKLKYDPSKAPHSAPLQEHIERANMEHNSREPYFHLIRLRRWLRHQEFGLTRPCPNGGTSRDSLFSLMHVEIRIVRQMSGEVLGFNDPLFRAAIPN
jgi:hypothetical protein